MHPEDVAGGIMSPGAFIITIHVKRRAACSSLPRGLIRRFNPVFLLKSIRKVEKYYKIFL